MNAAINRIRTHSFEAQKIFLVMGLLIAMITFYFMIADSIAAHHYVQIDEDIWSFLKYVGVIIGGLITWALRELIVVFKNLVKSMNELNTTVQLNNLSVKNIEGDVSDIKKTLESHDDRIQKVEDKIRQN